jgi:hypothetical protein
MHITDDQSRMVTVNLEGATITADDKRAFDATIHRIGAEFNTEAERTDSAPRADALAEAIAVALRETLTERGHGLANVSVRPFNPDEEASYMETAKLHGLDNSNAKPDQARIGVEFINGVDASETQDLKGLLVDLIDAMAGKAGQRPVDPLPQCIMEVGEKHSAALMQELIEPGLRLFANAHWLEAAKIASPRGVQAAAVALMVTLLDYDYTKEVIAMNVRTGPASGLLRALLIKAGRTVHDADNNHSVLNSYITATGEQDRLVPWKEDAPVATVNAVMSHGIMETMDVVADWGEQYQSLHKRAEDTGQAGRFDYHSLNHFAGDPDDQEMVLRAMANLHSVMAWTGAEMATIKAEAEQAEAMAKEALRTGDLPRDASVQ